MLVLVSLVSGQTMPNYFGIKHYNPDKCIFLYTKNSKKQMEWLKKSFDVKTEEKEIIPYDYDDIQNKCKEIIDNHRNDELILNYTCGTKIMSIASFEIFLMKRLKTFYVDSENQRILEQYQNENIVKDLSLNISVNDYVRVYGNKVKELGSINPELESLGDYILTNFKKLSDYLLKAAKESNKIKTNTYENKGIQIKGNNKIVYLKLLEDTFTIGVPYSEVFSFIKGGWLEYVVYKKLVNTNLFDDIRVNVKIDWENDVNRKESNFKNEIDIFCTLKGVAYFFECKSGGVSQDVIYRYKALKEFLGGTYSKVVFVTFFPVSSEQKEKLKDFGFELCNINYFDDFIKIFEEKIKPNPNL
ncbi:MAG TPA: DUF1887 family CARF protein [Ignavibacteria bacterium]